MEKRLAGKASVGGRLLVIAGLGLLSYLGTVVLVKTIHDRDRLLTADEAEVAVCRARLPKLYAGLLKYEQKMGALPHESGVRFLAAPIIEGVLPNNFVNAMRLTCPGVSLEELGLGDLKWDEWWFDSNALDGSFSSYAGRDMQNFPLDKLDASEPLAACDNAYGPNHIDATHVLYADGSVRGLSLEDLIARGVLPGGAKSIPVGPSSPIDFLRMLSLD